MGQKISIVGIEKYVPGQQISTKNILDNFEGRFSRDLLCSIKAIGVSNRYSILQDMPEYLAGKKERTLSDDTSSMKVAVIEKLHSHHPEKFKNIGLYLSATDTANRPIPCTAYEVAASLKENYLENSNIINMQNQGCSVLLKMIELAQDYIETHPGKYVLLTVAESNTGLFETFTRDFYEGFSELKQKGELKGKKYEDLELVIGSFLFGDGAVGLILGPADGGDYCFENIVHCTNRRKMDKDLLTIKEGGILTPEYSGFPHYSMSKDVPERGARYAELSLSLLEESLGKKINSDEYDKFFLHTGSKRIIDGICKMLCMEKQDERTDISYDTLSNYANLSAVSIPMMLADTLQGQNIFDNALLISFGAGFSVSSGFLKRS